MDKRLLITFVVLAGLGFLYLAYTNQKPAAPAGAPEGTTGEASSEGGEDEGSGVSEGAATPLAAVTNESEGVVELRHESDGEGFVVRVSPRGATISSALMLKEQYHQVDNQERPSGLPPAQRGAIPERYYAEGPLELVSTWSEGSYPFQVGFDSFEHAGKVRRVIRAARGGGEVDPARPDRFTVSQDGGDFESGYPKVAEGDLVEILAPAALAAAGARRVVSVRDDDELEIDPPFELTARQEDVSYRVVAEGAFDTLHKRDRRFTRVDRGGPEGLVYVWPDPDQDESDVYLERRIRVAGAYALDLDVLLHSFGEEEVKTRMSMSVVGFQPPVEGGGLFSGGPPDQRSAICHVGGEIWRGTPAEMMDDPTNADWAPAGSVSWIGVESRYFLLAAVPKKARNAHCRMEGYRTQPPLGVVSATLSRTKTTSLTGTRETCVPDWMPARPGRERCSTMYERLGLPPGASKKRVEEAYEAKRRTLEGEGKEEAREARMALRGRRFVRRSYRLFLGPKDLDYLRAAAPDAGLGDSVDFWIVGFLAEPMVFFLKVFHGVIPHWGVAIVLLTILVKLLLLPLTHKSFKSMQAMTKLKPEMEELRKQYGNDKQKLNQEMMALYKRHKVNPLGGCLPLLLQMPLYIALYRSIYASVELYQAPLFGWIHDLSAPDPYYVMPLLLGASMFLQQKISPTSVDSRQQRMMMYFMPIMFTVFMLFLPSGLVLYIFVNTLLTMVQQFLIKKKDEAPPKPAVANT